jgi:hypothetical protein
MRRLGRVFIAVFAFSLLCVASASADTRYAAPGGTGADPCAEPSDPCSIYTAADYAAPGTTLEAGDTVELAPGTYSEADGDLGPNDMVQPPPAVVVRGEPGAPRPVIVLQSNNAGWGAFFLGPAAEVLGLEVRNQAVSGAAITAQGGVYNQVIARSTVSTSFTCTFFEGTMLSSACINRAGGTAIGVSVATSAGTHASNLRNSTFVASGAGSVGMDFAYFASSPGVIGSVYGVGIIAKGEAKDVVARGLELSGGHGATTLIELLASDYATTDTKTAGTGMAVVTPAGTNGNITAPPLLAEDGVHQLLGSPTIDKGAVDGASASFDVDGQAREIGLAPDIGADELGNPTTTSVSCAPATVAPAGKSTCTVTVVDGGTVLTQPTGEVALPAAAGLDLPSSCTLAPALEDSATCSVSVVGTALGAHTVTAVYAGDNRHEGSQGSTGLTVAEPPSGGGAGGGGGGGKDKGNDRPPNTQLKKHPPKLTAKRKAKFTFTANEANVRFECKLDKKPFKGCVSPFKKKVKPGKHKFQVRAVDAQGRVDATPAVFRWKVIRAS